jgi:hypothetical protein
MYVVLDNKYKIGSHVKKYPSFVKTILEIRKNTYFTAVQIYVSNGRSKNMPYFDMKDLIATRKILQLNDEIRVYIHGSLLYNLAGTTGGCSDENYHSSLASTYKSNG